MIYAGNDRTENTETISEYTSTFNSLKILAVDDLLSNLDLIKIILELYGAEVHVASSVWEALIILDLVDIDVLISDLQMPNENGFDLIRQVRQLPNKSSIPAIALTASITESDRKLAFACGFQCYITKPFDPAELVTTIAQLKLNPDARSN